MCECVELESQGGVWVTEGSVQYEGWCHCEVGLWEKKHGWGVQIRLVIQVERLP